MKTILNKLNNRRGESIAEVLVALMISALALVLLASMISTATSLVTNSRSKMAEYYGANTVLSSKESGAQSSSAVTLDVIQIEQRNTDGEVHTVESVISGGYRIASSSEELKLTYYVNGESAGIPVISYKK